MEGAAEAAQFHSARQVFWNDGVSEDKIAIVVGVEADTHLRLLIDADGAPAIVTGPRREKADYGAEGGGNTWHL